MTDLSADYGPGRSAPQALEAEEAVLGCILIDPQAFFDVAPILRPDDFYLHKHRWVWDAVVRLHDQRLPVDTLTLAEELERHSQLAEVGGTAFLARLLTSVPTSLHAEAYARLIEREATRRRLMEAATAIAKLAAEDERDINEVVNEAESTIFAVSERKLTQDITPIKEAISDYYDRLKYLAEHGDELLGVPTGFVDLDKLLGGLQKSDLLIVAGRPGSGKTGLMLNIAKAAAQTYRKHVAVFSLEMSNEQLVQRLISQETGIDSRRLRMGELRDDEWPLLVQAASVMSEAQIFLDDTPGISPTQLRSKCRRLDQEFGLDLIVVDYLQLMQGDRRNENRVQEVSDISRKLKLLARELNVPVLAGAQLSRAVEQRTDKRPILSDLRESGCLTGDSLVTLAESGVNVPIRELVGQSGFTIWALNLQSLRLEATPVSHAFTTGIQPAYQLATCSGRVIQATAHHPFLTPSGWKRLDELQINDRLAASHTPGDGAGIHWDQIVSIESGPPETVFDLTVPGYHNFVANNIVAHNSLEQDSDIVMFIHRPDMYEDETSKTNIANLIIAKHRNGPTGDIQLIFRGALTKFENAETRRVDLQHV